MTRKRISKFEAAAQRLIEGSFSRFLGGRVEPQEIATKLARALEDSYASGQVETQFTVRLHPTDLSKLETDAPELADQLVAYLLELAQQANIHSPDQPQVQFVGDETAERFQILVESTYAAQVESATEQYDFSALDEAVAAQRAIRQVDAFIIVDGRRHISLTQPITSLGRHIDSDIILDSSEISRKHAQIRWRYNRFVIYDLGSRTGTRVNGSAVSEYALQPGDVITFGKTTLIYGEGVTQRRQSKPTSSTQTLETQTRPDPWSEQNADNL